VIDEGAEVVQESIRRSHPRVDERRSAFTRKAASGFVVEQVLHRPHHFGGIGDNEPAAPFHEH
jgi:hypothetical protein